MAVQNVAEASSLRTSGFDTRDSAQQQHPGFRHFLGTPNPSQRFRAFGIDPLNSPEDLPQLRGLMHRLSRRMDAGIHWPPHQVRSAENWENPFIPSGYTYLLQFVAHDLVHSAIPLSVAGGLGGGTANARRTPLRLETLYGSGPVGSPHIYALDAPNDDRRTKLRLGRMRWKENEPATGCPFRDIARTRAENVTGIDRSIAGVRVALTEALVADPRNDDHAVMSQLTALFALLHNGLIDIIRRHEDNSGPNGQFGAAYKRFLCAREALTAIYHNILRNDLMRRVIHPAVYAAYDGPAPTSSTARIQPKASRPGLGNSVRVFARRVPLRPRHGAARIPDQRPVAPRPQHYARKDFRERSRQHAARRNLDGAVVALLRNQRIDAESQPPHRTASQRRAGQRPDLSGVRRKPNESACSIATCSARDLPACGRWMR